MSEAPASADTAGGGADFDGLEALVRGLGVAEATVDDVVAAARGRADRLGEASGAGDDALALRVLSFLSESLAGLWLERSWSDGEVEELLGRAAGVARMPGDFFRLAVFGRLLRERHVLELPPRLAVEALLGMLVRFAPVGEASVWTLVPEGGLELRAAEGSDRGGRRARAVAQQALTAGTATARRTLLHGVAITRWNEPHGALVVRTRPETRDVALAYALELAVALGPLLEIEALLERNAAREQSLVGASERRLVRLGADIHDGPLQDLAALATDLRLFRTQLARVVGETAAEHGEVVLGRIDDLEARLVALYGDLRDLSSSLASPGIMAIPFPDILRGEIEAFTRQTSLHVDLRLSGKFDLLTASQRIALLRVVREALQNVRDHSGAGEASVTVDEGRSRLRARIEDRGVGFDVEQRLVQAARAGRLGLVGMGERIRLLGGRFDIESRPGGPTVVSASIPRWQPPQRPGDAGDFLA